ncbi:MULTISPECIES: FUSC family protein [Providencia]|uniref:FUSC family protein n=2 Tax=Morganellaceae TaxID=1903414 RepID=UPI0015EC5B12|nr:MULTISPECIES: FUSC family protein [Providencia]ELR5138855.1 FUSC family protein [Providencia rettgeri]ELR5140676.1 FUSC family protein [Providencia rettgeri]ELR5169422.1 FUSC family protein [Providencia rettgeri]ELR5170923.1 FUSC family protein [Providencia rettgeri]QLQ95819.1 FUSC family protein [Providencia rettgeri]
MKLNWIFAVKYMLAILLAWYISSYFGFDKPYWSMMTVAIIGYPDPSLSLAKMVARLAGSFIGVIAVTLIANISISDHWLFTALIIIWLSVCLFMALTSRYMMPYMFSLSGYTSAIIAFGTSVYPLPMTIFNLSQERLMEVMIGIIIYTFISYALPNRTNNLQTVLLKRKISTDRKDVLSSVFKGNYDNTMKNLSIIIADSIAHDEVSKYESHFLSFKKAHSKVLKLPMLVTISIIGLVDRAFLQYEKYNQILSLKNKVDNPSTSQFYVFFDWKDAFLNTLRLVVSLVISVIFWLNTGWEYGYILPVLVSISFTFGVTIPNANKLAFIVFIVALLVIALSYVLKFFFLIQASSFMQAALIMTPVFILLGVLKTVGKLAFLISHIMCISLIFLINFTNPMSFDFVFFANTAIALIFSIIIVILMLYIIPLSNTQQIESRKVNFILQKINTIPLNELALIKIRNTLLMNVNSLYEHKNINQFYVLIALISLYELSESEQVRKLIVSIINAVSIKDNKDNILKFLNGTEKFYSDINVKYAKDVIGLLL